MPAPSATSVKGANIRSQDSSTGFRTSLGPPVVELALPALDASFPLLLLPVRIETRLRPSPSSPLVWQLCIRVFPDRIHVDTHSDGLTPGEVRDGRSFWGAVPAGTALSGLTTLPATAAKAVEAAWASLAGRYGSNRASWIVTATDPAGKLPSGRVSPHFDGLPDQFIALAYSDASPTPLVGTFLPLSSTVAAAPDPSGMPGGDASVLPVDSAMHWALDFDGGSTSAVKCGLGVTIEVPAGTTNFSRIIVLGLRNENAAAGRALLETMLGHHHRTDGLALVRYGDPTKNSLREPAAMTRRVSDYAASLDLEFGSPRTQSASAFADDGLTLSSALRVDPATFDHVLGAEKSDVQDSIDMLTALWPATGEFYLSNLIGLPADTVSALRVWATSYVSGRGRVPSVRLGSTLYGVHPVTALDRWPTASGADPLLPRAGLVEFLRAARGEWAAAFALVPHISPGASSDSPPGGDSFVQSLAMDGLSLNFNGRVMLGADLWVPAGWVYESGTPPPPVWYPAEVPYSTIFNWLSSPAGTPALAAFGLPASPGPVPGGSGPGEWGAAMRQFYESQPSLPLVPSIRDDGVPLSETDPLPGTVALPGGGSGTYLDWLANADIGTINADTFPGGSSPRTLLYLTLRQARLLDPGIPVTPMLQLAPGAAARHPSRTHIQRTGGAATGPASLAAINLTSPVPPAIQRIAGRATSELNRLFAQSLDIFSHRLDAWISSIATSRLAELVAAHAKDPGIFLGAYSWVENLPVPPAPTGSLVPSPAPNLPVSKQNLVPRTATGAAALRSNVAAAVATAMPAAVAARQDNAGFIHAPSLDQAAALAVLRTANLTHRSSSGGQTFAVDLASKWTRLALEILDGMREGDTLGALLGSRFELELSDAAVANVPGAPEAVLLIPFLRQAYPLTATVPGTTSDSSVPDGLALQSAYAAAQGGSTGAGAALQPIYATPLAQAGPPNLSITVSTATPVIQAALDILDHCVEALGDLALAESVYHLIRGNPARAGAILQTSAQGGRPPEVMVANTPTRGSGFTQRVLVALPAPGAAPWASTPRAVAEPRVEAWLASMLPSPGQIVAGVTFTPPGSPAPTAETVDVTLEDLGIGALDFLEMASASDETMVAELEQRLFYFAGFGGPPYPADGIVGPRILYDPPGAAAGSVSLHGCLGLARALKDVLTHARPLSPSDVNVPGPLKARPDDPAYLTSELGTVASHPPTTRVGNLLAVATSMVAAITASLGPWDAPTAPPRDSSIETVAQGIRTALLSASGFGIPLSVPPWPSGRTGAVSGTKLGLSPSHPVAGSTSTYTVSFKTGAAGKLGLGKGTVTLLAPPGTRWPLAAAQYVIKVSGASAMPVKVLRPQPNEAVLTVPSDIPSATHVTITVDSVTNPGAGDYGLSVVTSADPQASLSAGWYVIRPTGTAVLTGASVAVDGPSGTATWKFQMQVATDPAGGPVTATVLGPPAMSFSALPSDYSMTFRAGGTSSTVTVAPTPSGSSVSFPVPIALPVGAQVRLEILHLGLPSPGFYAMGISLAGAPVVPYSFFVRPDLDALVAQARRVLATLQDRLSTAQAALAPPPVGPAPDEITSPTMAIRALLGRGFLVVPSFTPWDAASLQAGFGPNPSFFGNDDLALTRWVQQGSHVRPGLSRLELATTLSAAFMPDPTDPAVPHWTVGQMPALPNDRWLALPTPGRLSFVQVSVADPIGGGSTSTPPVPNTSTYVVRIMPGSNGALTAAAKLTFLAPAGTVFPSPGSYQAQLGDGTPIPLSNVTVSTTLPNEVTLTLGNATISPSQRLDVTVGGVTNPRGVGTTGCLVAYSSADPAGVASPDYPIPGGTDPTPRPTPPNAARVALACLTSETGENPFPTTDSGVAGLLVDEWPEQVPDDTVTTGLAVHYNAPRAQAPQAWLLAVAPPGVLSWTENGLDLVLQTILETIDLTKLRMVDLLALSQSKGGPTAPGEYLPALYMPLTELSAVGPLVYPQFLPPTLPVVLASGQAPPIGHVGPGRGAPPPAKQHSIHPKKGP
ncbi:MAG: hypothetical protein L3K15_03660 [Thermoplasmata archaeon]|nr:hypothetical protein [Thermoplasmata archaeon]